MLIKFIYSIISLVLNVLSPIVFYFYSKQKNIRIYVWDILIGIVVNFLCKHIIVNNLIGLMSKNDTLLLVLSLKYGYLIAYIFITTIMLFLGLIIVNKFYYHNKYSYNNVFGLTIGMTLADILYTTLMAALSNLIFINQIQKGVLYANLVNFVSPLEATNIIEMYTNFPSGYFLYVGIVAITMLASNYLVSALLLNLKEEKIMSSFLLMFTISLFTIIYYYSDPTKFTYTNLVLLLFLVLQFIFAELNIKIMQIEDKNRAK